MEGTTGRGDIGLEQLRNHFEGIERKRYEELPKEIAKGRAADLRKDEQAREVSEIMKETPSEEEIREAVKEIWESAPGVDGIRISYIRKEVEVLVKRIVRMVQVMFESPTERWMESLWVGITMPLFKKGARGR